MRQLVATAMCALALPNLVAAAITFDSSFEGGNGTAFTLTAANTYSFQIEPDTGATDRQWFLFSVAGAAGQTLTFRLLSTNTTNVPSHWNTARPVASSDGGVTWQRVTGATSHASNVFSFTHTLTGDPELIAFHHPYSFTHAQARMAAWDTHPDAVRSTIGASTQGRAIEMLRVTDASVTPPGGKRGFWIVARQHAAEVPGSWMLDGFMEFLLSSDMRALGMRRQAVWNIVPFMNPDGAVAGNYRVNALGVNLNRVWDAPSPANSPEVKAVTDAIAAWVAGSNRYDFFADLHGDSGALAHYAFHPTPALRPAPYHADLMDITGRMELIALDFTDSIGESSSTDQSLSRQRQMIQYGVLALLFEGTYTYPTYGPQAYQHITPERHAAMGEALAIALQEHFLLTIPAELTLLEAN